MSLWMFRLHLLLDDQKVGMINDRAIAMSQGCWAVWWESEWVASLGIMGIHRELSFVVLGNGEEND